MVALRPTPGGPRPPAAARKKSPVTADLASGDRLQVFRDHETCCYLACSLSGPERARILDLFGTDTLPLPWTAEASEKDVLGDVRRRNPNATIEERELRDPRRACATHSSASPNSRRENRSGAAKLSPTACSGPRGDDPPALPQGLGDLGAQLVVAEEQAEASPGSAKTGKDLISTSPA